jgi:excisionase family DNA binding protein
MGDVDRRIAAMGYAPMASKQDQQEHRLPPQEQRLLSERASTPSRDMEMPARAAGLDPIVAEIIEALARNMGDIDNRQRRLVEFKDGCRYGKFGKTKAYELIAQERIRAYKMGGKTMIDLDSVDEYHASLPRVESRAS